MINSVLHDFFVVLCNALAQSIWQVGLLWFFYIAISRFTTNIVLLYNAAALTQLLGFAIFVITIINSNALGFYGLQPLPINALFGLNYSYFILGILYSCTLVFLFLKTSIGYFAFKKRNSHFINIDQQVINHLQQIANIYCTNKKIIVGICNKIYTPLTYGYLKPIILFPLAAINQLNIVELEYILLHEIAHIKRNDFLQNIVFTFIKQVLFFNPFAQLLAKEIEKNREYCCDKWVLKQKPNAIGYANALLSIASIQKQQQISFALNAIGSKNDLLNRVKKITNYPISKTGNLFKIVILAIVLFLTFALSNQLKTPRTVVIKKAIKPIALQPSLAKKKSPTIKFNDAAIIQKINTKANNKKNIANKPIYSQKDIKNLSDGLFFLSELATQNEVVHHILVSNPSIQALPFEVEKPIEINTALNRQLLPTIRRFFVPPTAIKNAVFITITVTTKENGKKVVTIEVEEGKVQEKV